MPHRCNCFVNSHNPFICQYSTQTDLAELFKALCRLGTTIYCISETVKDISLRFSAFSIVVEISNSVIYFCGDPKLRHNKKKSHTLKF